MRTLKRRDGAVVLRVEEFIGELFDLFKIGEELRRRDRWQFGVAFECGLRNRLRCCHAKEKREQPARSKRQAQWSWNAGEQRQQA